ncbi:MAG: type II secretion system F family protein [Planctomycetota bacterium]
MMPLVLSIAFGLVGAMVVWALQDDLRRRWERDVAWLQHTIWRFTPDPFDARPWVAGFYVGAVVLLFLFLLVIPFKLLGVGIWVLLIVVPKLAIDRAWAKRRKTIEQQLPVVVRQMSSSVGSGMTLVQAIERLGERGPEPIRTEFRIMANYWKMGSDFGSTIEEAKRRLALKNFTLFASAILVNQRMGGNVTETLDRLADSLESLERMRRDVYAATAEGRTNIKVLAVAPFIMLGLIAFMDPGAVGMLFTTTIGLFILAIALLLAGTGTAWAWKVVNADV